MAYLAPEQSSPDHTAVVVTYRVHTYGAPVFVVSSANNWVPEEMVVGKGGHDEHGTLHEKTFKVSRGPGTILYKFRVGDGDWVWDTNAPTEYDGFSGQNNRFDVPVEMLPSPPPEPNSETVLLPGSQENDGYLDPESATALPSPAHTPRDLGDESGTELEAPSVSDWEPDDRLSQVDHQSEPEILPTHGSPTPSHSTGAYSIYFRVAAVAVIILAVYFAT